MLKLLNITKYFYDKKRGKIIAVDNVDFECVEGKIFGLLGPNGAGKTTILRIISTLLKPTSGEFYLNGINGVKEPLQVKRKIGFLSGDTGLYDRLTAYEMVEYFGKLYGLTKKSLKQRIDYLFEVLNMNKFRNIQCGKLSAGTKQKVSIARTLINDPPVLVMDEPTQGLDVITSRNIVNFIKESKQKNKCIIFSTHIMSEAEYLCDEIGILHKGKIYARGTIDQLRQQTQKQSLEDIFLSLVGERDEY